MPVVLDDSEWATWLDPHPRDPGELMAFLRPREGPELRITPVSRLVNDVRNDGPELVVPIGA
jgi:putative SOS response-associated peptidase YedK